MPVRPWTSLALLAFASSPAFALDPEGTPPVRGGGATTLDRLVLTRPGSTGDASLLTVKRSDGVAQTLRALSDSVAGKPDRSDLGAGIGVAWRPFEHRILVTKSHAGADTQQALDIQVNTRPGANATLADTGSGVSITSRALPGTTYGMFNLVALMENHAERLPGGVDTGNTGASLYARQYSPNSVSGWGYAAEAKEVHGLPNPRNGTLAGENAIVAVGTDAHRKRAGLFIPLNILPGHEATFTEAAQGWYVKTSPNTRFFDGGLFEGAYGNVINANGVDARSLIVGTGRFAAPIIDLHAAQAAENGAAIALNAAHAVQWQKADGASLGSVGFDTSVPTAPTLQITGMHLQPTPDGGMEAVIRLNGKRYGLTLRALP